MNLRDVEIVARLLIIIITVNVAVAVLYTGVGSKFDEALVDTSAGVELGVEFVGVIARESLVHTL